MEVKKVSSMDLVAYVGAAGGVNDLVQISLNDVEIVVHLDEEEHVNVAVYLTTDTKVENQQLHEVVAHV